jgi:CheY-like chemotaxis protein
MSGNGSVILVVDDSTASRYITSSWLRRGGHEVIEAETGGGALTLLHERPIDLVVLDVQLPDMSGFEVCERIKQDPATAVVPVIHVSASFVEPDDRAQGLSRGADAYLTEPVDPSVLLATVEAALRYYRGRVEAERLARRLSQLTQAGLAVNAADSFGKLVRAATEATASIFDSPATVTVVTSEQRARRGLVLSAGEKSSTRVDSPAFVDRISATALGSRVGGQIISFAPQPEWPGRDTAVAVVRSKEDQPPVCIALPADAVTTQEERDLLLQMGQLTAVAAQSLRAFTEEHSLALTLQRSLLPAQMPEVPEVTVATRYVPAAANAEVGGDFYEVAEVDGKLLVAIGDVTGHSIEAATIMGEVRHALRAYAVEGHDPGQIVVRLDAMLRRFHPRGYTTLCVMLVDLAEDVVSIANAGHIPPLFVDEQSARFVYLPGPLLGIDVPRPEPVQVALPPGTTVVLMTDGLVERRGVALDDDMETLRATMRPDEDLEALCDRLLNQFGQNKDDDIALVAFRRIPPG